MSACGPCPESPCAKIEKVTSLCLKLLGWTYTCLLKAILAFLPICVRQSHRGAACHSKTIVLLSHEYIYISYLKTRATTVWKQYGWQQCIVNCTNKLYHWIVWEWWNHYTPYSSPNLGQCHSWQRHFWFISLWAYGHCGNTSLYLICWSCFSRTKRSWCWNAAQYWMLQSNERWIMSQGSTLVPLCHFLFSINRGHYEYSLSFRQLKDSFADKEPAVIRSWLLYHLWFMKNPRARYTGGYMRSVYQIPFIAI